MESMTREDRKERKALNHLADALVDDILCASDEEILAEFQEAHGDPDRHAAEMRHLFEKTVIAANKRRLAAAKAGAAASRRGGGASATPIDIAQARRRLRAVLEAPNGPKVTLAARKESELTDADILGMVEDLRELGVIPPDDDKGGRS
jgi:hypothetical protein